MACNDGVFADIVFEGRVMAEIFLNETGFLGELLFKMSQNVTGSDTLTYVILLMFILIIIVAMRVPIEVAFIFSIPLVLLLMTQNAIFLTLGGIYLMVIVAYIVRLYFT